MKLDGWTKQLGWAMLWQVLVSYGCTKASRPGGAHEQAACMQQCYLRCSVQRASTK